MNNEISGGKPSVAAFNVSTLQARHADRNASHAWTAQDCREALSGKSRDGGNAEMEKVVKSVFKNMAAALERKAWSPRSE